ncbi:MAG: InlB B-repeat-containing protein [Clostridiales bacterium]|jgi:uncharacterized repeat protein (TIGR02543 family)|nr:InlB B-repeat-containing protein [Clostridiales bacterium]
MKKICSKTKRLMWGILSVILALSFFSAMAGVLPVYADEGGEPPEPPAAHTLTIQLNGGSRKLGVGTFSEADVTVSVPAGALTFTHEKVWELFGNIAPYKNKADGTHVAMENNGDDLETEILRGLFIDEADPDAGYNGVYDDGEELYLSGDTVDIAGDVTLSCYYDDFGFIYSAFWGVDDWKTEVSLSKAWKGDSPTDVKRYFTARELQPFYHKLTRLDGNSFSPDGSNAYVGGIELPDTVRIIEGNVVKQQEQIDYIKGLENVAVFRGDCFFESFKETYKPWNPDWDNPIRVVFGEKLEVLGAGTFVLKGAPIQAIFTGWDHDKLGDLTPLAAGKKNDEGVAPYHNKPVFTVGYGEHRDEYDSIFSKNEPPVRIFVPHGETEDWYPADEYIGPWTLKTMAKLKNAEGVWGDVVDYNIPMREMFTVSFDLNGGAAADGKGAIANEYQDAGARSVIRGDEEVEVNLTLRDEADDTLINSKNEQEQNLDYLSVRKPENPVRDGYSFVGWEESGDQPYVWTDADWGKDGRALEKNTTLTAKWAKSVTITLYPNTSEIISPISAYEGEVLDALPRPKSKTNFTFDGWYEDDEVFTVPFIAGESVVKGEDFSLYAKWTAARYDVKFHVNGGVMATENGVIQNSDGTYGAKYTYNVAYELPAATRERYTFESWYGDPQLQGAPVTSITAGRSGPQSVYAKWTANFSTYSITYNNMDGAQNASENPAAVDSDREVTLHAPAKDGFEFLGWYDNAAFSGDAVTVISIGAAADVNLYAKWEELVVPVTRYNITYELNGGTNASDNPGTYTAGTALTLKAAAKEGFVFKGWYKSADFGGEEIKSIAADSTGDVKLYAKWEEEKASDGGGCGKVVSGAGVGLVFLLAGASALILKRKKTDERA